LVVFVAGVATLVGPVRAAADALQSETCIALVLPSVRGTEGNATDIASSLRDLIASYLTGPSLRTMALEARLPAQAIEEARQKDCGRVLTATLTRKHNEGGLGRTLGRAAGAAAWHVPYGGTAAAAAVRGAAVVGAVAVSSIASETRAKDEMRLEYRLSLADGTLVRDGVERAKASVNGEDLVTPLVERLAGTIVAAMK
jgi:hypothetical protein